MKILHINKDYADNGGTERYLFNLCEALERLGNQIVVIYGDRDRNTWRVPGRQEYFVPHLHEFSHRANGKVLRACLDIMEREEPDVINLHQTFNPGLVHHIKGKWPLIRSIHSPYIYCLRCKLFQTTDTACNQPLGYHCFLNTYLRRCSDPRPWNLIAAWRKCRQELESNRKVDNLVVFSNYMKDCLLQNEQENCKVTVLPYFTNGPVKPIANSHHTENIILYVGRITKEKGLDYLLRAVKQISLECKLLIVGDGWYLPRIKALTRRLGLTDRVEFPGWISPDNLSSYYAKCSLLAVPSIWPEPFGIVGLEAMSYSKPVVAFDVGGISDWLDHGNTGYLIKPRDINEMAARIEVLLKDQELATKIGEKGKQRAEQEFGASDHVNNLLGIYKQSIEKANCHAKTDQVYCL